MMARWLLLPLVATSATTRLTRPAAKQAFVVLKRGHSGSTWLSALLLNLPLTYFFDELVGASANFDAKKLEAIFVQALRAPSGRGASPEWSKSTGDPAVRNCWQNRATCQLNAIGFSFSPLLRGRRRLRPGISSTLQGVITKTRAKPILFLRTNVVKLSRAVNGDKTALKVAGVHRQLLRHRAPHRGNWSLPLFVKSVNDAIRRNNDLLGIRSKVRAEWLVVYYERLQTDTAEVMDSIRRLLVIPRMDKNVLVRTPGRKTTSDDLRDVVFNFGELEDALEGRYNSPCVLKMLREVRPTVHPVCGVLA
jgi:hypothetical protein